VKILKETPEKWVKLDVEMDDFTVNALLNHADKNMSEEERKNLYLNWAFLDVIRKQLAKEVKQCRKR
jgi:hypothetical protein